jgi:hypothetical protein
MFKKAMTFSTVLSGLCLFASAASAQTRSILESSLQPPKTVSVELKPLPTMLSAVPGVAAVGLGAEIIPASNFVPFINANLIDGNLPNNLRNRQNSDETPQIAKMRGYSADTGVRYYFNDVARHSWYGGAKVGYSLARGEWEYKDEKIVHTMRTVTPGVEGGYRWNWPSNVLLRLGVGADSNIVQENRANAVGEENSRTKDAEDKVQGYAQVAVVPRVDLGLGYTF